MTWHDIMEYAHQGIELKNLPGLAPNPAPTAPVAQNTAKGETARPAMLSYKGAQVLVRVERMMEEASHALAALPGAAAAIDLRPASDTGSFADANDRQRTPRGN
jgi:penicillin-binding protein 1A